MTATSLSPETGQDTGQTFALKGYGGQVGFNPQTGAFTNVGLPGQERAVSGAKPDQATGGGMESAGKRAVLAAQLKGKIPEAEITKLLDTQFPETKPNKGLEKDAAYIRSHAPNFYNKETGQPAGLDVIGQDLNPDEFRKTHIELNKTQQQNVDALGSLDSQINSYEALASTLGRSAEPGKINTLRNKLGTISGRLGGDPTVATLDASRAQITQIARAFGGDSRVSDREMQLLQNSVISDSDNLQAIQAKIGQLKRFREDKAKRMGLPWLMTGRAGEGDTQRKTLDQGTAAKFLNQAGGDKNRARELAKAAGYTF
jgi:hypothetical protein